MSKSGSLQTAHVYEFSVFHLDVNEGLSANGQPVKLPPKQLQTLTYFVENPGRLINKNEFFDTVWADSFVEDGALSFNISRLRKALAEFDPGTEFIETVSKRGFRFLAEVRKIGPVESDIEITIERHEVRELYRDEEHISDVQTQPLLSPATRSKLKTVIIVAVVILLTGSGIGLFLSQRKTKAQQTYLDSPVDELTWKSAGSTIYSEYSASHNGNFIAYSSTERGDNSEIYLKQFKGQDQPVTKDGWDNHSPVWSPDDREIAYVSDREGLSEIYRCTVLCDIPTLVYIVGDSYVKLVSWSKNGPAIFYEVNGNLFRIAIDDGAPAQITDFTTTETRHFAISGDERKIAYRDIIDGRSDIWIKTVEDGSVARVTNDADQESDLKWHPDGERLFFSAQRGDQYPISVVSTSGGEPTQLTYGEGKFQVIDVLSNGTGIIYKKWQEKFDISTIDINSGEERPFASELGYEYWAEPSPDGGSIAYQLTPARFMRLEMNRSSVLVRDVQSGDTIQKVIGFGPRWLDSRRIAFFRKQETAPIYDLWLFDTKLASEKRITFQGATPPSFPQFPLHRSQVSVFDWSRSSDRFAYLEHGSRNVVIASPGDEGRKIITDNRDSEIYFWSPIWSPDGTRLVYLSGSPPSAPDAGPKWTVWLYEGGVPRILHEKRSMEIRILGWSLSGTEVIAETTNGVIRAGFSDIELLRIPVNGGEIASRKLNNASPLSMTLSPDTTEVAYVGRAEGREAIYRSAIAGNATTRVVILSDPDLHLGNLAWSSDGKTVFMDKQEEINIVFSGLLRSDN